MCSVKSALLNAKALLDKVSPTAQLDADILLSFVLEKPRVWLRTWPEATLTQRQQTTFQNMLDRRALGEPVAYLVGEQEFWSLPLKVTKDTLIPRPETELLVELALERLTQDNARVIDLGTGTGAIALAIASEKKQWVVCGVDFSKDALEVAKYNAQRLQLNVDFFQSNWLSNVPLEHVDLIVSNPPYIANDDPHLMEGDVRFEPGSALIADDNGLNDFKKISQEALGYLVPNGLLMFEHGFEQGESVRNILSALGYSKIETIKDLAGLDRVTLAAKK